ncbi:MAG: hypothetical protein VR67_02155 [Peptococcaceae bacterium BRH_c8a]|nr:MAG: hypothetical protein VR67_02155 [Peptococcaceae bacterium BRH_c8a]
MDPKIIISKHDEIIRQTDEINFFKPITAKMRDEVRFIGLIVFVWAVLIYGFQILLILTQENAQGESFLTRAQFIGFPFHYWYTAQFTIIMFIVLCAVFSYHIQKIYDKYSDK